MNILSVRSHNKFRIEIDFGFCNAFFSLSRALSAFIWPVRSALVCAAVCHLRRITQVSALKPRILACNKTDGGMKINIQFVNCVVSREWEATLLFHLSSAVNESVDEEDE